jgi:hypothetical protein
MASYPRQLCCGLKVRGEPHFNVDSDDPDGACKLWLDLADMNLHRGGAARGPKSKLTRPGRPRSRSVIDLLAHATYHILKSSELLVC